MEPHLVGEPRVGWVRPEGGGPGGAPVVVDVAQVRTPLVAQLDPDVECPWALAPVRHARQQRHILPLLHHAGNSEYTVETSSGMGLGVLAVADNGGATSSRACFSAGKRERTETLMNESGQS